MSQSIIAQTPPIESASQESASAEETLIRGAPREQVSLGNLDCGRQPLGKPLATWTTGHVNASSKHCVLSSDFEKQSAFQGKRCPQNDSGSRGKTLAPA